MTIPAHTVFDRPVALSDKRVAVIGLARTGLACVRFLVSQGAQVVGADSKPATEVADSCHEISSLGAEAATEFEALEQLEGPDLVVVSPGVPYDHPALAQARAAGIEVIGELELAYRFCPVPIIAISGTNGKGTTTTMTGLMLEAAGVTNVVAGNIGVPVISQIDRARHAGVVVAEVSSFQLETIVHFRPWIAVLLNITPDHLDRHADIEEYAAAKLRLFQNQAADDYSVLCIDDLTVAKMPGRLSSQVLTVSASDPDSSGRVEDDCLVVNTSPGVQRILPVAQMPVPGQHNVTNALAAALAAGLCGATGQQMAEGLKRFAPADHLLAEVVQVGGIRFVDDSKATNTAAAIADLSTLSGPLLVIAGGQGKEVDFSEFGQHLARRCRFVCLIGESGSTIEAAVGDAAETMQAASMREAVEECYRRAESGDAVVLLPGCASFDMFEDQTHRGEQFTRVVREIAQREARPGV